MDELDKCPYCGADASVEHGLVSCSDKECWLYRIRIPVNEWQYRPLESALRAELEAARQWLANARDLIDAAVELMTPEQVGQWRGVRTWLETLEDVMPEVKDG